MATGRSAQGPADPVILGGILLAIMGWAPFGQSGSKPGPSTSSTPGPTIAQAFAPAGFSSWDYQVAFRWVDGSTAGCFESAEGCWVMEVVTRGGCPNGLYVELSVLERTGAAVGYTNDTLAQLGASQEGKLSFDTFEPVADEA